MSLTLALLLIALVLFVLVATGVTHKRVNLTAAGLAFVTGALIVQIT